MVLAGRSGESLDAATTIRSFLERDKVSAVCDTALAERQRNRAKTGDVCPPSSLVVAEVEQETMRDVERYNSGLGLNHTSYRDDGNFVYLGGGCGVEELTAGGGGRLNKVVRSMGGLKAWDSCMA